MAKYFRTRFFVRLAILAFVGFVYWVSSIAGNVSSDCPLDEVEQAEEEIYDAYKHFIRVGEDAINARNMTANITQMWGIVHEVENVTTPPCLLTAKNLAIRSMKTGIEGFEAVSAGNLVLAESKFDVAGDLSESFEDELARIHRCAPDCE
ncbi:MAG: hypothetical protein JXB38_17255 [Anaerolineales bacterium]|nr:hypothetical protein [Anaerolineales bacterium]